MSEDDDISVGVDVDADVFFGGSLSQISCWVGMKPGCSSWFESFNVRCGLGILQVFQRHR